MALDAELINLKSAGTYRFERDKSEISNVTATIQNLRLVVGFSKTGPFNTVKLVTSSAQFIKLYGNIDRSLEKKGSFFHRSALVSLAEGPILCLNLLNLDPDLDQVVEKTLSISTSKKNCDSVTLPLQSLYNTDKFWYPSDEAFLDAVKVCLGDGTSFTTDSDSEIVYGMKWNEGILHITNVGKKPLSILIKKASDYNSKGYQLTLNEWYGEGGVPEYLNGTSYVSDYMVEVYVVAGDFGPALRGTPYSSLVDYDDDADGESVGDILTRYSIDDSESPYKRFSSDIVYQSYFDVDNGFKRGKNDSNLVKFLNLPSVDLRAKYVGSLIPNFCDKLGRNIWIQKLINDDTDTVGLLCAENVDLIERVNEDGDFVNENIDIIGNNIFANFKDNIESGDASIEFLSYKFDGDASKLMEVVPFIKVDDYFYTKLPDKGEDYEDKYKYVEKDNEVIVLSDSKESPVSVGDYILSGYTTSEGGVESSRVTRVVEVRRIYHKPDEKMEWQSGGEASDSVAHKTLLVVCADKIDKNAADSQDGKIVKVNSFDKVCEYLQWISLPGFNPRKEAMPDGTNDRQNMILDMLRDEPEYPSTVSNLYRALIDRNYVQWRYLIDTFGLGLEEECKSVYTKLCQGRMAGFAIVNCPSQMDFKKSLDPSFTNKMGGVEAEFIAKGGDPEKNPSFLFTLPSIENGASWGAYYYPYLRITDLSAPKSVPPAPYVGNLYINKYKRGYAWSIVAGQKRGVISGNQVVGVEATLIDDNRDWLEPVGINPIIWENGVGVEVYANKTAKQNPVSALSSAHVREAAIYIQDGIESILKKYVFEFNTAQTRLEIKTLVDEFLNTMKSNDGLYDFRTVMDTSNNTPEVIDNNRGVIDVYVEIVRGLEIIAQRLTILKTGSIAAGGFE